MAVDFESKLVEINEFRISLDSESDRGCALMAGAYLDGELEKLLRNFVVENKKVSDEIFGLSRPIGTFSARIDMAYLLGLIGTDAHRDLHLIRKIRNDFGHVHTSLSFENKAISSRCRELKNHFREISEPARKLFMSTSVGVLAIIHSAAHKQPRLVEAASPDLSDFKNHKDEAVKVVNELLSKSKKRKAEAT